MAPRAVLATVLAFALAGSGAVPARGAPPAGAGVNAVAQGTAHIPQQAGPDTDIIR